MKIDEGLFPGIPPIIFHPKVILCPMCEKGTRYGIHYESKKGEWFVEGEVICDTCKGWGIVYETE